MHTRYRHYSVFRVKTLEIRLLVALYPPPSFKDVRGNMAGIQDSLSISALSGRRGQYAHAYGICAPFYCISLKKK